MRRFQELVKILRDATAEMKSRADCSSTSVVSGGELFLRFITLASEAIEHEDVSTSFTFNVEFNYSIHILEL